jgi:hypothetical protein
VGGDDGVVEGGAGQAEPLAREGVHLARDVGEDFAADRVAVGFQLGGFDSLRRRREGREGRG